MLQALPPIFTIRMWLIVIVASISFLFGQYEPDVPGDRPESLAGCSSSRPERRSQMDWLALGAALSGGFFGLLGGWLVDKFGRKTVMVGSIMVYSFAPVLAAFSRDIPFLERYVPNSGAWMFGFFRCATFVGVCVEFVAAVTWLSELFPDKRKRELVIGWTLAISSLGGIFVTEVFNFIGDHRQSFPAFPIGADAHATWRYAVTGDPRHDDRRAAAVRARVEGVAGPQASGNARRQFPRTFAPGHDPRHLVTALNPHALRRRVRACNHPDPDHTGRRVCTEAGQLQRTWRVGEEGRTGQTGDR